MAADPKFSHPKYLLVPVIAIFFILFSVSRDAPGDIEFVNVPCSSAVIIAKDFGTSSLSTGQSAPEKQSMFSLGQTAIFSKNSQLAGLNCHDLFSYNTGIDFLRIQEEKIKYDLIISSNTNRSPPSSIS
jgi:hypothetical protein